MDENKNLTPEESAEESIQLDEVFEDTEIPVNNDYEQPLSGVEEILEDETVSFTAEISKLKEALVASEDKNLRLQAEFQNFRKRTAKDISSARNFAVADTVSPFLQVFDFFNMAVKAAETTDNVASLVQGMSMIQTQFSKALEELDIEICDAVGKKFDHNIHEAVATEASDTVEEGYIIRQWNCGYKLGEQILRPARVVVSGGPAQETEEK